MCTDFYKEIKSLFLTSWKMVKFSLQKFDIFNMITDSFLIEKWGTLELARRHVCKNLLNLDCQDRSLINRVPWVPCVPVWSTCLRANVPTFHFYVPTCHERANVPTCQRRANFWNWRANAPRYVPVFQLFFKRKYFSILKIFNYG